MVEVYERGSQLECVIRSESDAWDLLKRVANDEFGDRMVIPEFDGWPSLSFKFWRDGQNQVLTAPMMEGLLEVQSALYRAFLLVEQDTSNLRRLSEYHRERFEILFEIRPGSTDATPNWPDVAKQFVQAVSGRITGKQATIVILAALLSYAGYSSWKVYLDNKAQIAQNENSKSQIESILQSQRQATQADLEKTRLLAQIVNRFADAQAIVESSEEAKDGVLKAAKRVDETQIGDVVIPPEAARRMARTPREEPVAANVTGTYIILRNDTTLQDGFRVRLKDQETGEEFFATLRDTLVAPGDRDLIARAEWQKIPIRATVSIKRHRGQIVTAQIVSAQEVNLASN